MNFTLFKNHFYNLIRNSSDELKDDDIRMIYNAYINHIQRDIIRKEEQIKEEKRRNEILEYNRRNKK